MNRIVVAFVCWITFQLFMIGIIQTIFEHGLSSNTVNCKADNFSQSGTYVIVPLAMWLPVDSRLMERCGVPR